MLTAGWRRHPASSERFLVMSPETEALVVDLVTWIAAGPKPYSEVMDAWRTSCPRLPVWEEANDHGFVARRRGQVEVTEAGLDFLAMHGRKAPALA